MYIIEIYKLSDELKKQSLGYYGGTYIKTSTPKPSSVITDIKLKIVNDKESARKYHNVNRCSHKVKHLSQYYSYKDLYFTRIECL